MGAIGSFKSIVLSWTNPADRDLAAVEVWASQTNDRSTATMVGAPPAAWGQRQEWTHGGLGSGQTWYYWLRTRDRSGNVGNFRPLNPFGGVSATTQLIDEADLAANAEGTTRRLLEEMYLELLRLLEVVRSGDSPTYRRLRLTDLASGGLVFVDEAQRLQHIPEVAWVPGDRRLAVQPTIVSVPDDRYELHGIMGLVATIAHAVPALRTVVGFLATVSLTSAQPLTRLIASQFAAVHQGPTVLGSLYGADYLVFNDTTGGGVSSQIIGARFVIDNRNAVATVANVWAILIDVNKFQSGPITNAIGIYIRSGFQGVTGIKRAIYSEDTSAHVIIMGPLGLGTTAPSQTLSLGGETPRTIAMERRTTANASGQSLTVRAGGATVGATDKAGGDLILSPGPNTGTGRSLVRLKGRTVATASGTGDGIEIDRELVGAFQTLTNGSAVTICQITVANNTVAAGMLRYAVEVFDGTDLQVEEGLVSYHITNKGGTIANNVTLKSANQQAVTAGTLTVTWTITAANPALLQVTVSSSLTPSAGYPRVTYSLDNLTQQAVTVQ